MTTLTKGDVLSICSQMLNTSHNMAEIAIALVKIRPDKAREIKGAADMLELWAHELMEDMDDE